MRRLHQDKHNWGQSLIFALGDYAGGGLWIQGQGEVNIHHCPAVLESTDFHATMPFCGRRYCVVAYTSARAAHFTEEERCTLQKAGFPVPTCVELRTGTQYQRVVMETESQKVRSTLPPHTLPSHILPPHILPSHTSCPHTSCPHTHPALTTCPCTPCPQSCPRSYPQSCPQSCPRS